MPRLQTDELVTKQHYGVFTCGVLGNRRTISIPSMLAQTSQVMPNIYYCPPLNRGLGILRAVLSGKEAGSLLNQHATHYVGKQFPTTVQDRTTDFAVLHIHDEEIDAKWRVGFYSFDADIMRIEEAVQACTAKLS